MQDMELKDKVLKEIMALMDEKEGENLKAHPKLVKPVVEKTEVVAELSPELGEQEPKLGEESDEELSPEMIEMLLKKLQA